MTVQRWLRSGLTTEVAEIRFDCTDVADIRFDCTEVVEIRFDCTEVADIRFDCTEVADIGFDCTAAVLSSSVSRCLSLITGIDSYYQSVTLIKRCSDESILHGETSQTR